MKETVQFTNPRKMFVRNDNILYCTILYPSRKQIQFSLFSAQDVVNMSEFEITHRELYTNPDRLPAKDGVLDRRLVRDLPRIAII
jgi:hypothetical protein